MNSHPDHSRRVIVTIGFAATLIAIASVHVEPQHTPPVMTAAQVAPPPSH